MRIVFMGTPDFAEVSLQALIDAGHNVVGVYCQPDKPVGRKHVLTPPEVKACAQNAGIPVFQPVSLRKQEAIDELRALEPELIVVVAYGKILPPDIIHMPKYGCINVHGSLLPAYRGAAPVHWSVIHGCEKTGVTTMYMDEGLDTGDMIDKAETVIGPDETSGEVYDRLAKMGAELLLQTIVKIKDGTATREKQDDALSNYAPLLNKEIAVIDFTKSAAEVKNLIRGLNPWPIAFTKFDGKKLKVFSCEIVSGNCGAAPGEIVADNTLTVACGDGNSVRFKDVLLEGSKRCDDKSFLLGHPTKKHKLLGE